LYFIHAQGTEGNLLQGTLISEPGSYLDVSFLALSEDNFLTVTKEMGERLILQGIHYSMFPEYRWSWFSEIQNPPKRYALINRAVLD